MGIDVSLDVDALLEELRDDGLLPQRDDPDDEPPEDDPDGGERIAAK